MTLHYPSDGSNLDKDDAGRGENILNYKFQSIELGTLSENKYIHIVSMIHNEKDELHLDVRAEDEEPTKKLIKEDKQDQARKISK